MEIKKCVVCGREFTSYRNRQLCCSPTCSKKRKHQKDGRNKPTEYRICDYCGQTYEVRHPSQRFCSWECGKAYQRSAFTAAYRDQNGLSLQTKTCPTCGKNFETMRTDKIYCSEDCQRFATKKSIAFNRMQEKIAKAEGKSTKTLSDWEREASECNLDYGTYRGLIAAGKTYDELKVLYSDRATPAHSHASNGSRHSNDFGYGTKIS